MNIKQKSTSMRKNRDGPSAARREGGKEQQLQGGAMRLDECGTICIQIVEHREKASF